MSRRLPLFAHLAEEGVCVAVEDDLVLRHQLRCACGTLLLLMALLLMPRLRKGRRAARGQDARQQRPCCARRAAARVTSRASPAPSP